MQCSLRNKKISIRVNEALAYECDYLKGMGQVVGARISFMGYGRGEDFWIEEDLRRGRALVWGFATNLTIST